MPWTKIDDQYFFNPKVLAPDRERCDPETWAVIRAGVLKRDNYRCQGCGVGGVLVDVHHIVSVDAGGSDDPANLLTLCRGCHARIHPWLMAA